MRRARRPYLVALNCAAIACVVLVSARFAAPHPAFAQAAAAPVEPKTSTDRFRRPNLGPPKPPPKTTEGLEVDLSVRAVPITSSFGGTEITVFGSVLNSRQTSAESGYYDVVVAVEGTPVSLVARRKTQTTGIWINTSSIRYDDVPSYYTLASTRPVDEITGENLRADLVLGFEYVPLSPAPGEARKLSYEDLGEFRAAVTRLKQKDGLYTIDDYGVAFIGRSLFRSAITLPQNVPLGPLNVRIHLFHDGELLGSESIRVVLEREGTQRHLHDFAFHTPLAYGVLTVVISVMAGIAASHFFRRSAH